MAIADYTLFPRNNKNVFPNDKLYLSLYSDKLFENKLIDM